MLFYSRYPVLLTYLLNKHSFLTEFLTSKYIGDIYAQMTCSGISGAQGS
jgi:hypothetical protein